MRSLPGGAFEVPVLPPQTPHNGRVSEHAEHAHACAKGGPDRLANQLSLLRTAIDHRASFLLARQNANS